MLRRLPPPSPIDVAPAAPATVALRIRNACYMHLLHPIGTDDVATAGAADTTAPPKLGALLSCDASLRAATDDQLPGTATKIVNNS